MLSFDSIEEYALTAGLVISFVGLIAAAVAGRKEIVSVFRGLKLKRRDLIYALAILLLFVITELALVKPTQLLFFDDVINQGMAQQLLNSGQAWMCNYGTASTCYQGDIFHEPIGAAFNIAIGFLIFGVSRGTAYGVGFVVAAIAVAMTFLVAFLLFKDSRAALFSELFMALSPVLLVWAMPTQTDMYLLAYSLIAFFFMEIFRYRKNVITFAMLALSLSLAIYMKVDGFILAPIIILMYIFMDDRNIAASVKKNLRLLERNMLNTKFLLVLLIAVLVLTPMFIYATSEATTGDYGAAGGIQNTCNNNSNGTVQAEFSLQNFEDNVCGNALFWFDAFQSQYVIEPPFFTVMVIVGVFALAAHSRNTALALGTWFIAFFILYCAFYAGSVTYGVDWRFQLSLMPPANMFAGFACASLVSLTAKRFKGAREFLSSGRITHAVTGAILVIVAISMAFLVPALSVQPSAIQQAGNARFYENLVYNSSYLIPSGCLVFSYDPELYNLNGFASRQLSDLYTPSIYKNMSAHYPCIVVDWGYWCYTPNNLCTNLNGSFIISPIKTAVFEPQNQTFGFYLVKGSRNP